VFLKVKIPSNTALNGCDIKNKRTSGTMALAIQKYMAGFANKHRNDHCLAARINKIVEKKT